MEVYRWKGLKCLVITGLCIFGGIEPLRSFGLFSLHDFLSWGSHLVTILGRPTETASLVWTGRTASLISSLQLSWHPLSGLELEALEKDTEWKSYLLLLGLQKLFGFLNYKTKMTKIAINLNCSPYVWRFSYSRAEIPFISACKSTDFCLNWALPGICQKHEGMPIILIFLITFIELQVQ